MQIYLVGGAVRDQLLNLKVKDRDWVVVGATPKELLSLGYQQVGRNFPVFLHPTTKEEYALARTEKKLGMAILDLFVILALTSRLNRIYSVEISLSMQLLKLRQVN